jgi:hypothetical protein
MVSTPGTLTGYIKMAISKPISKQNRLYKFEGKVSQACQELYYIQSYIEQQKVKSSPLDHSFLEKHLASIVLNLNQSMEGSE